MIALGGHHSTKHEDEKESIRLIQRAVDEGITFFDNAWDYHDGVAEERMGKALADGGRQRQGLPHDQELRPRRQGRASNLEDSLRRLKTDHLDLWQFHEINYDNDPDWIVEKAAPSKAPQGQEGGQGPLPRLHRPQGPAHPPEDARQAHDWDTVQMPINVLRLPLPQLPAPGAARARSSAASAPSA